MNDTLEFILVVLVIIFFYWFAIWSTIKRILRMSQEGIEFSKITPLLLAAATFVGTTLWGIFALIFGDGSSDNSIAPFPPIALLSSLFAIGMWGLATIIVLTFDWLFSLWMKVKSE